MGAPDELDQLYQQAMGGGTPSGPDELDQLYAQASAPPAQPMPTGKVIDMPVQKISGDDPWYTRLHEAWNAGEPTFTPEQETAKNARQYSAGMANLATPAGMALNGARYLAGPMAAAPQSVGGMALAGGAESALEALAADPNHQASSALRGFVPGVIGGAGAGMLARGLSGAAGGFNAAADENRLRAASIPDADVERMTPSARADMAAGIENMGLHEGSGPLGFLPQGPRTYARNGMALERQGEGLMRSSEDAIGGMANPPQVPVSGLIDAQHTEAGRVQGLSDPGNQNLGNFRQQFADNLEADTVRPGQGPVATMAPAGWNGHEYMQPGATVDLPTGELPWPRALEQRRNIDQLTKWNGNAPEAPGQNATRKEFAGGLRSGIDTALDQSGVPPNVAQDWRTGRDMKSLGATVAENSLGALPGTNLPPRIPTNVPMAAATAGGMMARTRAYPALAGAQRSIAGNLQDAAIPAQAGTVQDWLSSKGVSPENVTQQARGNQLAGAAQQLLKSDPQSLGQYQQQLADAAGQGSMALNALITKLSRDPDFRAGPLLRMQHMTGDQ
jgi:hypothetical protein